MKTIEIADNTPRTLSLGELKSGYTFEEFCRTAIEVGPVGAAKLGPGMTQSQEAIKRTFDTVLSATALVVLAPLLILIALGIKLSSPGPIIFAQERVGRHGRPFTMLKFRSMYRNAPAVFLEDGQTAVAKNDNRVFSFGRFLRRGLDELPQLINVLRGEMSLVGPRPDEPCHVQHYRTGWFRKLDIRPGITGLPQVCGRRDLAWRDRVSLDVAYAQGYCLRIEVVVLLRTAGAIVRDENVA